MPLTVSGSCQCGKVTYTGQSQCAVPYMHCYCGICRKTGGGEFGINIRVQSEGFVVTGEDNVSTYQVRVSAKGEPYKAGDGQRHFCSNCGTHLWGSNPKWPQYKYPLASCVDSELPQPTSTQHIFMEDRLSWVTPPVASDTLRVFDRYPEQSLEQWHKEQGLFNE